MRIRKPKLPLSQTEFAANPRLRDADGRLLDPQEVAWVAREASAAPELRRKLREAEKRAKEAEAKLTKARDDALEEAARVADAHAKDWLAVRHGWGRGKASAARDIAEELRALKSDADDSADGHGGAAR